MNIKLIPYELQFKETFKIAHTIRSHTDNCYVLFQKEGISGIGEAVYPPYVNEDITSLLSFIDDLNELRDFSRNGIILFIEDIYLKNKRSPASVCAVEQALVDWWCKKNNSSVIDFLQLPSSNKSWFTSYTIGLSTPDEIDLKMKTAKGFKLIKLKVDELTAYQTIKHFSQNYKIPMVVDANQAFQSVFDAESFCHFLKDKEAAYLEQPFSKLENYKAKELVSKVNVPIIADESFQCIDDLKEVSENFSGINVKLMKCGGLIQACKIITKAREHGLRVVLGCMSGSYVTINYAENLATYADWVDLDGKYLINNNPSTLFLLS